MKYEIGARIRYYRELRGLSQKDFAEKIGMKNSRVSNWEQGINRPDADILATICSVLQVSADALLGVEKPQDEFSEEERQVIHHYRSHREHHQAVRYLLGMEKDTRQ